MKMSLYENSDEMLEESMTFKVKNEEGVEI